MTERLLTFPYFGGKQRPELQEWILERLPHRYECYIEPYAGALGILVNRPRSRREIASDLNGRIVNWWEVVRERCEELQHKLRWTPNSEKLYYECATTLDEGDAVERAWKLHVTLTFGRMHTDAAKHIHYSWRLAVGGTSPSLASTEGLGDVRDRIRNVTLLNKPALEILERAVNEPQAVVYCDPPYTSARTDVYHLFQEDREATVDVLRRMQGDVAISGYNDDWDELGWERHEFKTNFTEGLKGRTAAERTEVLWTNYPPPQRRLL